MNHSLNRISLTARVISNLLYVIAVAGILLLPVINSLNGQLPAADQKAALSHLKINSNHLSDKAPNSVWTIIQNKHLAARHVNLRIKAATVITLLFVLSFAGLAQQAGKLLGLHRYITELFSPYPRYILNQNFLL